MFPSSVYDWLIIFLAVVLAAVFTKRYNKK